MVDIVPVLLLVLAQFLVGMMSLSRKFYERANGSSIGSAIVFIIIATLLTTVFMPFFFGWRFEFSFPLLLISAAVAVFAFVATIICIVGVDYGNMSMLIAFAVLGVVVISSVYGLIFVPEKNKINVFVILGYVCVAAIAALNFIDFSPRDKKGAEQKTEEEIRENKRKSRIFKILCVVVFFANGIVLPLFSVKSVFFKDFNQFQFLWQNTACHLVIALAAFAVLAIAKRGTGETKQILKRAFAPRSIWTVPLYWVVATSSDYISLYCTEVMPIIIQAPLTFALPILFTAAFDFVFFRAKISLKQWIQIGIALVASVLLVL